MAPCEAMHSRLAGTILSLAVLAACDQDPRPTLPVDELDASFSPGRPEPRPDASCDSSIGQEDFDDDGFSRSRGDCDDCDPMRGPAALEVAGNGLDEDCVGGDAPLPSTGCDGTLEDDEAPTLENVRAVLGLCGDLVSRVSRVPGLVDARWLRLDGSERLADPLQVWLPTRFGERVLPREGGRMLVLSTGIARDVNDDHDDTDDAYTEGCDAFAPPSLDDAGERGGVPMPAGFPRGSDACPRHEVDASALAYDDVGLALTLRVPTNATAVAFDSILFTYEYPEFMCGPANDHFVALLDGAPRRFEDDNILVDANDDPVGVNSSLLTVCNPTRRDVRDVACRDAELLEGTGYAPEESTCGRVTGQEDIGGASTGWLRTAVPVAAGELIELRLQLWDSGDRLRDTTVAIDNLRFLTTPLAMNAAPTEPG